MAGAPSPPPPFYGAKHRAFVLSLEAQRGERLEFVVSEHLRLSALYWGLSALETLSSGHLLDKAAIVREVQQCRAPDGGYSGAPGYDSHLLHTAQRCSCWRCAAGAGAGAARVGACVPWATIPPPLPPRQPTWRACSCPTAPLREDARQGRSLTRTRAWTPLTWRGRGARGVYDSIASNVVNGWDLVQGCIAVVGRLQDAQLDQSFCPVLTLPRL